MTISKSKLQYYLLEGDRDGAGLVAVLPDGVPPIEIALEREAGAERSGEEARTVGEGLETVTDDRVEGAARLGALTRGAGWLVGGRLITCGCDLTVGVEIERV